MSHAIRRSLVLWFAKMRGREVEYLAPHGVTVRVPSSVPLFMRYHLYRGRPYEQPEADMVRAFLAPGTNVVELGGAIGIVAALVRHVIGPSARHVIAEALPDLAPICAENAAREADSGATEVIQAAVDYSGSETVTFDTSQPFLSTRVATEGATGITVPTTTLAALAEKLPEGPFALVCDIEGAELSLFRDERPEVLARVSTLILETHPDAYPGGVADAEALIARIEATGLELARRDGQVICFTRPSATP